MSLLLNQPFNLDPLDRVKLAALKIEENKSRGQRWVEFWLVFGRLSNPADPESFVQYVDPITGREAKYIKLEYGVHPLAPDTALGKCNICGKWFPTMMGSCDVEGCTGTIKGYDGWMRAVSIVTAGNRTMFEEIRDNCYNFLINEIVPDPITWEPVKLLDAQLE
jgi:hypothetical protein